MVIKTRISSVYFFSLGVLILTLGFILKSEINSAVWSYNEYRKEYQPEDLPRYDLPQRYKERMNEFYKSSEKIHRDLYEYNKSFHKKQLYYDGFNIVLTAAFMVLVINIIFFTRIILTDSLLQVYFPPKTALGPLAKPAEISVRDIRSLQIVRTTPFGPDLKDMSKMNWRDILEINGLGLQGYIFGGLGKIYTEIIKLHPGIKTGFRKRTVRENMANA